MSKRKFDIGDKAWMLYENKVRRIMISGFSEETLGTFDINGDIDDTTENVYYTDRFSMTTGTEWIEQGELYSTKEELMNAVFK